MNKNQQIQQYAALWMHSQGFDKDHISNTTGLSIKQIDNAVKKHIVSNNNQSDHVNITASPVIVTPNAKQLMITETSNKKQKVAIMTKEASQIADEQKKHYSPKQLNTNHIFRPNNQ